MPSIKYKKKTYAGGSMPVLEMTKAQYDALPAAKQNDGTIYLITDGTGGWEAEDSVYDNTESGLTATNVQDALDEIADYSTLTFSNYFTISGVTISGSNLIKVAPHLAYFHLDISGSFSAGQTVIGSCVAGKLKEACYVPGRCSMSGSVYPATGVLIPNGQIRIHCQGASTAAVLNGYVFI